MSTKAEIEAILKNDIAQLEALVGQLGSISLTCFTLKDQGDSGLEVRRLLGKYVEQATEMRLIDLYRGFGDQPAMSPLERSQYRANRADDLLDMTSDAFERINDYVHGRAA